MSESAEKKDENSYRSILKGTSAFGGVQIFQILVNAVRGKFVAVFLGPDGVGVSTLFATASSTIQQFASLGLNLAIVKEIAASRDNAEALQRALGIGRRLIYATAFLGALVCILFASPLSRLTFGSERETLWFVALSAAVFMAIAGSGEMSLLQGMHAVKRLSFSSLVGAIAGLVFGVPLYWLFGVSGIVPAMIVLSFTTWMFYLFSVRRTIRIDGRSLLGWRESLPLVRKLLGLGFVLMGAALLGTLTTYFVATYLRSVDSVTTVGLYQAANSITNQYIGMVIAAMGIDYFPRLAAVATDNVKVQEVVNRQTHIITLLATPILILVMISAPVIIRVLFTSAFEPVVDVVRWMAFGVFFRVLLFPLGYIFYAKDNKRLYFILEGIVGNVITFTLSVVFFHFFGLTGLGMAVGVDCSLAVVIYLVICRRLYSIGYSRRSWLGVGYATLCAGGAFICSFISVAWISYASMSLMFLVAGAVGFFGLRKLVRSDRKLERPSVDSQMVAGK